MDYLTIKETGEKWSVTGRMVTYYCVAGRIPGVIRKGNMWLIPADAEKPHDSRTKSGKTEVGEYGYEKRRPSR